MLFGLFVLLLFILGTLAYFHVDSKIPMCFGAVGFAYIVIILINQLGLYDYFAYIESGVHNWKDDGFVVSSFIFPLALYVATVGPLSKNYYKKKYGKEKLF